MTAVLLCCVCLKESSGAHTCSVCHKTAHAICSETSPNEEEEGYGSAVVCKNCSNDEPPIKKTLGWVIKYTPESDSRKHKKPQPAKPPRSLVEQEKRCICLTCFRVNKDPSIYVMSRRDNSTKERHLKRRHEGETVKDITIVDFECSGKEIHEAKTKYFYSVKEVEDADSGKTVKTKQKLITAAYGSAEHKDSDSQVNSRC